MANAFLQQTDNLGHGKNHLQVGVFFVGQLSEFLHRPLLVDLVSFLHSDSLLFFLAEKTTAIIMTAVESRYFLRINGHPLTKLAAHYLQLAVIDTQSDYADDGKSAVYRKLSELYPSEFSGKFF